MDVPARSLTMPTHRRWLISVPFVLALLVFVFISWSITLALSYPYDGILGINTRGLITEIDPHGPSYGKIQVGDIIASVDSVPAMQALPFYADKHAGEAVDFQINRQGDLYMVMIAPVQPPLSEVLSRLISTLVALSFWLVGVGVLTFQPSDKAAQAFFYFCLVSSVMLTAGSVSYQGPPWLSSVFNFFLCMVGPLAVHFHLHFPQTTQLRGRRFFLWGLYLLAFAFGAPSLILGQYTFRASPLSQYLITGIFLFLSLCMLFVVGLLFYSYRHATKPGVLGKIRLVVLGGVLSTLPVVALTILPHAIFHQPVLIFTHSFLFLAILPLTYGYAIFRYRLIEIDKHVNRGATYILVFSFLVFLYLFLYTLQQRFLSVTLENEPLINTLMILIMASGFVPLYRMVQRIVDIAFYGSWYDYRSAVRQITQGLEQLNDLQSLAQTIGERLVKTLRLEDACVFLRDHTGEFSVIEVSPRDAPQKPNESSWAKLPRSSLTFLLKFGAVEKITLRRALAEVSLTPEEQDLLESLQVNLWVPIIGQGSVLGQFALGPKLGGDIFSGEDLDILRVVALQAGSIIENIHLLNKLRQYASELERRVEERTSELHAEKERVEAILFSVGEGVIVMDLHGTILTVNQAFVAQSGYQTAEVVGKQIYEVLSGPGTQLNPAVVSKAILGAKVWSGEQIAYRKNGSSYDVQLTIAPIRDQEGEIIGYVGSQRDITERKKLDRLKDQFILEISHQLRTPVTNVSLYLDLLERGRPERRADYLATVESEIGNLARMIEDVLDLSRLEIGKYNTDTFTAVDLNLVTEQVLNSYRPQAEANGLQLIFEPDRQLPAVWGEQKQLARVVDNLLSNAVLYTPSGWVRVRTYHSGGWCCLEVQDTGIGIDPEDFPHLCERFYRGQKVSQSKLRGSGLGLTLVKEIIDIHGGRMEYISEEGHGALFKIWLMGNRLINEASTALHQVTLS